MSGGSCREILDHSAFSLITRSGQPRYPVRAQKRVGGPEGIGGAARPRASGLARRRGIGVPAVFAVRDVSLDELAQQVWVVAVGEDGQVHFTVLPGSVEKNRHLIGRALA